MRHFGLLRRFLLIPLGKSVLVSQGKVISLDDTVDSTLDGTVGSGEWHPLSPIEIQVAESSGEGPTQTVFPFEGVLHSFPVDPAFQIADVKSCLSPILGIYASDLSIRFHGADDGTTLDELDNPPLLKAVRKSAPPPPK
jgi:hypothetical protein